VGPIRPSKWTIFRMIGGKVTFCRAGVISAEKGRLTPEKPPDSKMQSGEHGDSIEPSLKQSRRKVWTGIGARYVFADRRLKESDVTCLYGPFHCRGPTMSSRVSKPKSSQTAPATTSCRSLPRPILKNRSRSDVILGSLLRKRHSIADDREIRNEQLNRRFRVQGSEPQWM